ncbi:hypothetical protein D6827_02345 [Candidatus Parcubacteria bacterium]|nr:MAG: hypothetical protein D6827_02345 [Candidatus Parcubacteria bacterium]
MKITEKDVQLVSKSLVDAVKRNGAEEINYVIFFKDGRVVDYAHAYDDENPIIIQYAGIEEAVRAYMDHIEFTLELMD